VRRRITVLSMSRININLNEKCNNRFVLHHGCHHNRSSILVRGAHDLDIRVNSNEKLHHLEVTHARGLGQRCTPTGADLVYLCPFIRNETVTIPLFMNTEIFLSKTVKEIIDDEAFLIRKKTISTVIYALHKILYSLE